ncbi:DMT family transporter [Microbacterium sp. NPDC012755]|uniref:DMT family transporter n=1 Tax=Microbacterium sp. NPDC012755 TaxID=3364184 RepID=UPI0036A8417E
MSSKGPVVALVVATVLWSTGYVLSAWALAGASPAVLSVSRFAVATAVVLPLAIRHGGLRAAILAPRYLLLAATGVTVYYSLANLSLLFTTAGTASLVAACLPVLTVAGARLFLGERVSVRTALGLTAATVGVMVASLTSWSMDGGVILNVLAMCSYAAYTLILRGNTHARDSPITIAAVTGLWGSVFMLPWLIWEVASGSAVLTRDAFAPILALALVVTGPTLVLFTYAAERLPASMTGAAAAAIPPLGYLCALSSGETLMPLKAVGGLIALAGVLVATLPTPRGIRRT